MMGVVLDRMCSLQSPVLNSTLEHPWEILDQQIRQCSSNTTIFFKRMFHTSRTVPETCPHQDQEADWTECERPPSWAWHRRGHLINLSFGFGWRGCRNSEFEHFLQEARERQYGFQARVFISDQLVCPPTNITTDNTTLTCYLSLEWRSSIYWQYS